MALTDIKIRNTPPQIKPLKLFDSGGLFLIVNPNGSRWWRLKYRILGKEKLISLGVYPLITLAKARERRDDARRRIADGIDPSAERRAVKAANEDTFESIAREWLATREHGLAPITVFKTKWMLESFIYPDLGSRPIRGITAPDILGALRAIAARGRHETARRTKQKCGQVFRYAIATGRASHDVTADLRGALAPVVSQNHAAITDPVKIGALLRAIDGYSGQIVTGYALRLAPMVFVRPGELRQAEWSEFDLDGATWRIPAAKMKMREEHIVPLAPQALALLRELHTLTGRGRFLFNSLRTSQRPMSENTINAALRRLGYSNEEMTGHGFRALASTCLNEQGWSPDLIELQLAHSDKDRIRAVYNRSKKLPERRRMMDAWADYLDTLRAHQTVVPIKKIA